MASLSGEFNLQEFSDAGALLVSGRLYTYVQGTTTQKTAYTDFAGTIAHTYTSDGLGGQYIALNARGELPAPLYLTSGSYDIALKRADGSTVWTRRADPIGADLAASSGAALIGFIQAGSGAVDDTVQGKNRQIITNIDFAPDSERAAILAGTSTLDLTAVMQNAINVAGSTRRLRWMGVVNCGALSSAASVDWVFDSGARIKQIPAVYGLSTYHITLSGAKIRLDNCEFDGNQDAMTSSQGSLGLLVSGVSPTLINVKSHDYNGRGYDCSSVNTSVKRGVHIGCNFDDNAGLGMQTVAAAYNDFIGCTFDRNGYGFQTTRTNYADSTYNAGTVGIAFGIAVRLRSHHLNFVSCYARDNGRDGFNVNQGSYAIKFAQCLAYGNDDGGFTIASDATGSGLPGESEACYDLEYIDCEAYNNYTSGLVAYQACHNVTVTGGRYYNNHRLAGNIAAASSYVNGIYFAGDSTGINVDAKCYDERQSRVIAVSAAGVLTATGWVPGAMNYYPKVAIYDGADRSFMGYGKITAESAGSVTIATTTFNGVTLAAIGAGDYVSQAVQHNGVFTDNNCSGYIAVDGAGHTLSPTAGLGGHLILSAGTASGQNIILPKERRNATELLVNSSFDADVATGWTYSLTGGGAANYFTTAGVLRKSAGALQLVGGTSIAEGDSALITGAIQHVFGEFVEAGVWAYASARSDAVVTLFWVAGGTFSTAVSHPGGGWRYIKVGARIPSNATDLFMRLTAGIGKTVYFDTGSLKTVELHADGREFTFPSRSLPQ